MNLIDKAFNRSYHRHLSKVTSAIMKRVNETYDRLSDENIKAEYLNRKGRQDEETMTEVFAMVYVAAKRVLGLTAHPCQLEGGIALAEGNLAQMNTGEGKTLVSLFPNIYRALGGHVHVVTVNEYLAERDHEILSPVYDFFGLSHAVNRQDDSVQVKQIHYTCDIMHSVASTLGFDLLRDNLVQRYEDKVCKDRRYFATIDEADLVLIDEARTPLIIGAPYENNIKEIMFADAAVKELKEGEDFTVDKKHKTTTLTNSGIDKIEKKRGIDNLYDEAHIHLLHLIFEAMQANFVMKEDKDYAVVTRDGEKHVEIIDTFTGRIQPSRRFSNGLHQALEAKHKGVPIKEETKTTATITLQNFFRLYEHMCGMSGTIIEEADEFMETYGLKSVVIAPNKPSKREDHEIVILPTKEEKWKKITSVIRSYHEKGYPVLVGTTSVEDSEVLSDYLKKEGLAHQVLNAKQDKKEAEMIARAGERGRITVSTNMAGRGTDIKPESDDCPLVVIVSELNESSRIDNQLKGRTARQGAPGITETIISAEDSIWNRVSIKEQVKKLAEVKDRHIKRLLAKRCRQAQAELEGDASAARQNALKFDDVIRRQREMFYASRDKVLLCSTYKDAKDLLLSIGADPSYLEIIENYEATAKARIETIRSLLLYAMDRTWVDQIDLLDTLKSAIGWRAQTTGHNPYVVYQNEARDLYQKFHENMREYLSYRMSAFVTVANF